MKRTKLLSKCVVASMVMMMSMSAFSYAYTETRPDPVGKESEPVTDQSMPYNATNKKVTWTLSIGSRYYEITHNGLTKTKELAVAPILSQGRTMLPARTVADLLGIDLRFDDITKTAKFVYMSGVKENNPKENVIEITSGKTVMIVNGVPQPLSAKPVSIDGRVMLSLTDVQRTLAELGLPINVNWDSSAKKITIFE